METNLKTALLHGCIVVWMIGCTFGQRSAITPSEEADRVAAYDLSGSWALQIENLDNQVVTRMIIRFTDAPAESCMAGDWRRIIVESRSTSDKRFFPASEPLSYELDGNLLVIGRNRICDAYLQLSGELSDSAVRGEYFALGLGYAEDLGYFSLRRVR